MAVLQFHCGYLPKTTSPKRRSFPACNPDFDWRQRRISSRHFRSISRPIGTLTAESAGKSDLEKHTLPTRALAVRRNALRYDPDLFWIAEFGQISIGGFGLAIRRRSFWYLAALHVLPEFQGCGVGSALVRRCLGDLDASDRPIPLLTTSDSANLASTGMYFRFGLLPQTSILQLQGQPRSLGQSGLTLRPTDAAMGQDAFDRLDQIVLGEIRPEDHQCWAMVPSMVPYFAYDRDRFVGYIYIDGDGALGPAAVERPELLAPTISAAFEIVCRGSLERSADQDCSFGSRVPRCAVLRRVQLHHRDPSLFDLSRIRPLRSISVFWRRCAFLTNDEFIPSQCARLLR